MLAKATDRFETLTLVLGYCGLRFGEAVALRRRHVGDRVLTVRSSATAVTGKGIVESTTKTKRDRHVPVPAPLEETRGRAARRPECACLPQPKGWIPATR